MGGSSAIGTGMGGLPVKNASRRARDASDRLTVTGSSWALGTTSASGWAASSLVGGFRTTSVMIFLSSPDRAEIRSRMASRAGPLASRAELTREL